MALAFAPATVSLNSQEFLPVQNGRMSRSYPRDGIMQSPTFCALTSVVRPTAEGRTFLRRGSETRYVHAKWLMRVTHEASIITGHQERREYVSADETGAV